MATPRSPYDDIEIDRQTRSIRLVRLSDTASSADIIECELRAFDLASNPAYMALSYAWGPAEPSYQITLSGIDFTIRENLWNFLRRRRRSRDQQWFWIDAICINQTDVGERNHQVQMMKSIYTQASQVTVWLGESSPEEERAIDFLAMRLETLVSERANGSSKVIWTQRLAEDTSAFLHNRYWRRVWIVQEIVLARCLVVRCGARTLAWQRLVAFVEVVHRIQSAHALRLSGQIQAIFDSAAYRVITISLDWPRLRRGNDMEVLIHLLRSFQGQESSDVRDRVYGYLGLLEEVEEYDRRQAIVADYSLSAADLFTVCYERIKAAYSPSQRGKVAYSIDTLKNALRLQDLNTEVQLHAPEMVVRKDVRDLYSPRVNHRRPVELEHDKNDQTTARVRLLDRMRGRASGQKDIGTRSQARTEAAGIREQLAFHSVTKLSDRFRTLSFFLPTSERKP